MIWLLACVMSCAPQPVVLEVETVHGGLEVTADRPIERVDLYNSQGALSLTRQLKTPSERVFLATPTQGLAFRIVGTTGAEWGWVEAEFPGMGPLTVEVEAPVGQARRPVGDGDEIRVVRLDEGELSLGVVLTAIMPTEGVVELGQVAQHYSLDVPGERVLLTLPIPDASASRLRVTAGDVALSAVVRSTDFSLTEARAALSVSEVQFPTDAFGTLDRARPRDRVTLPAAWWRRVLRGLGLGYRPRDDQAPWAWQTVTLSNGSAADLDVVLRASVVDDDGTVNAFRSQVRSSNSDAVTTLLRIPAGRVATASLPVFVSGRDLPTNAAYERRIEVLPLGSERPLHVVRAPLGVRRGSSWASLGFGAALLTSVGGALLLWVRGRHWLRQTRTSDLVTVSLFGSLSYVVATALQVVGMGLAALLGPFSPLVMGLADDAFRACLLGTLIALLPRPGIAAMATVVGFLMRGLTLGAFHPVDLLYVGSAVLWLEGWLWVSGCTRGEGWLRGTRWHQWFRLSVGLGLANLCATATGLAVSVVLYRLFLADWYVVLILALPGFLYVLVGTWLAVDFAGALKRVSS